MLKIYHNNKCGKSRNALSQLQAQGLDFEIVEYLKDVPSAEEIKAILKMLNIKAHDLIRTKESIYIEKFKGKTLSEESWIEAMLQYPILIERPIIVYNNRAVIARHDDKIKEILG
jgi:arsenate reductase